MNHTIICSCGKLAIECKQASKVIENLIRIRIEESVNRKPKEMREDGNKT